MGFYGDFERSWLGHRAVQGDPLSLVYSPSANQENFVLTLSRAVVPPIRLRFHHVSQDAVLVYVAALKVADNQFSGDEVCGRASDIIPKMVVEPA